MRRIPEQSKYTVAKEDGLYLGFTGVATAGDALVCVYNRTDQHQRTTTDIVVARSEDGGRTWEQYPSLSHKDLAHDSAIWVSPQISALRDGRFVIMCDLSVKGPGGWDDTVVISNNLFWSKDDGKTWAGPVKIDDVGGQPERIRELSDGSLMFTRREWALRNGEEYMRYAAVFSDDGGKSWARRSFLSDDPLYQDCEVGIVEPSPGRLLSVSRCGDTNACFGQPSRFMFSSDYGWTWSEPILSPIYGHRPIPGKLRSGKLMVTYRNCFGTNATYAFVFDPGETFPYQLEGKLYLLRATACVVPNVRTKRSLCNLP